MCGSDSGIRDFIKDAKRAKMEQKVAKSTHSKINYRKVSIWVNSLTFHGRKFMKLEAIVMNALSLPINIYNAQEITHTEHSIHHPHVSLVPPFNKIRDVLNKYRTNKS